MNASLRSSHSTLTLCTASILALTALLLLVQYSFGIGTTSYSLGLYIWSNWTENEDMGHGFLIVPAFFFLIYQDRARLLSMTPRCGWGGLPLLIAGLFLFWAGNQADVTFLGLVSVVICVVGSTWWLLGWEFLKALAFPIAFLLFAIPFPGLDMMVALPLRYLMSTVSVLVLKMVGIPVVLVGTGILSAPDAAMHLKAGAKFAVDVANPCSGIRSLFALMMVGALFAHFTLKGAWRKWILFLCTPPLAVMGNLARILMLTIGTIAFGSDFALGKNPLEHPSWFHMTAGYLVFIVALCGMMGIGSLLNRDWKSILGRWIGSSSHSPSRSLKGESRDPERDLY